MAGPDRCQRHLEIYLRNLIEQPEPSRNFIPTTSDGMRVTIRSEVEHKSEKKFRKTPNPFIGLFPRIELVQNVANLTELVKSN